MSRKARRLLRLAVVLLLGGGLGPSVWLGCPPGEGAVADIELSDPQVVVLNETLAIVVANYEDRTEEPPKNGVYHNIYRAHLGPTTRWEFHDADGGLATSRDDGDFLLTNLDAVWARDPAIATDGEGNATIVWVQVNRDDLAAALDDPEQDLPPDQIFGARFESGALTLTERVDHYPIARFGEVRSLQVAMYDGGDAVAVWECCGERGLSNNVFLARFEDGRWREAEVVSPAQASEPRLAVTDEGDAIVVWRQFFDPQQFSCTEQRDLCLDTEATGVPDWFVGDDYCDYVFDQCIGTAPQEDGFLLFANRCHPQAGCSLPGPLADGSEAAVGEHDGDTGFVVYIQDNELLTRRFYGGWQEIDVLDEIAVSSNPSVDTNDWPYTVTGTPERAAVVWERAEDVAGPRGIHAAVQSFDAVWSFQPISDPDQRIDSDPQVAINERNWVRAAWWRQEGELGFPEYHVYANRTLDTGAWEGERRVDVGDGFTPIANPRLAMTRYCPAPSTSQCGFGVVVWDDGLLGETAGGIIHAHVFDEWERLGQPVATFTFEPRLPVVGEEVTFDASESRDTDGTQDLQYEWDFDNDDSFRPYSDLSGDAIELLDGGVRATAIYGGAGDWIVRLRVTDTSGETDETSRVVMVQPSAPPPTASFTWEPEVPRTNEEVAFSAAQSNGNTCDEGQPADEASDLTYEWDFDFSDAFDPAPETGPCVTHAFSAEGNYAVVLRVTDDLAREAEALERIAVFDVLPPVAAFTWGPAGPQACDEVTFDASATEAGDNPIIRYSWEFDFDGTDCVPDDDDETNDLCDVESSEQSVTTWTFDEPGDHDVLLRVIDSASQADALVRSVTISAPTDLTAAFDYQPEEGSAPAGWSPLVDEPVVFDASDSFTGSCPVEAEGYEWDFDNNGGFDASGITVTTSFDAAGDHTVRLRVSVNDDVWVETTAVVTVQDLDAPTASFTFSPAMPDVGESVSFDASGSTPGSAAIDLYEWDFDYDGTFAADASGGGTDAAHSYFSPGTYTVRLRVTDADERSGETSRDVPVAVACTITSVDDTDNVFPGTTIELQAVSSYCGEAECEYTWFAGSLDDVELPPPLGMAQAQSVRPTANATYSVRITEGETVVCEAELTVTVQTPALYSNIDAVPFPTTQGVQYRFYLRTLVDTDWVVLSCIDDYDVDRIDWVVRPAPGEDATAECVPFTESCEDLAVDTCCDLCCAQMDLPDPEPPCEAATDPSIHVLYKPTASGMHWVEATAYEDGVPVAFPNPFGFFIP